MKIYLTKKQIENMENSIVDEETGMTEFDYWEWSHPYDELVIINDEEEK